MHVITIPKHIASQDDLVVLPRKEYEALLAGRCAPDFLPTPAEKRALVLAERNFHIGKTLSYAELKDKLGGTR